MFKKLLILIILFGLAGGCAALRGGPEEEIPLNVLPVITQAFASKEIRTGDTWKVYLKASYPQGKMKYIVSWIDQPGGEPSPPSMTRIKDENQKELSGFIYLNTGTAGNLMAFEQIVLNVQIQADVDHMSPRIIFPLKFSTQGIQSKPAEGVYKEQDLGPIMIRLDSSGNIGSAK
jgi:hypothetical protein